MTAAIIKQKLSLTSEHSFVSNRRIYSTSISKEQVNVVQLKKDCWLLRLENVRIICCFFEPLLHEVNEWSESSIERGGRNRIGRREKWPKQSWEEGEIGGKSREEGEKET